MYPYKLQSDVQYTYVYSSYILSIWQMQRNRRFVLPAIGVIAESPRKNIIVYTYKHDFVCPLQIIYTVHTYLQP